MNVTNLGWSILTKSGSCSDTKGEISDSLSLTIDKESSVSIRLVFNFCRKIILILFYKVDVLVPDVFDFSDNLEILKDKESLSVLSIVNI